MKIKLNFIFQILIVGIIVFFISKFFIQVCIVHGNSMFSTLKNGEFVLVKKYNLDIKNKDIVVIRKNNKIIIKRVVGIPNDNIKFDNGYVYVNNIKFDEIYTDNIENIDNNIILNDNEYYVLGDNRQESIDSRSKEIGIINRKDIIGVVIK